VSANPIQVNNTGSDPDSDGVFHVTPTGSVRLTDLSFLSGTNQIVFNVLGNKTTLSSGSPAADIVLTLPAITGTLATLANLTQAFTGPTNFSSSTKSNFTAGVIINSAGSSSYTQVGSFVNQTPVDAQDGLIVGKSTSTANQTIRGGTFEGAYTGSSSSANPIQGLNAFAVQNGTGALTVSTTGGGIRAGRYVNQFINTGAVTQASAISAVNTLTVSGASVTDAFNFHSEPLNVATGTTMTRGGGLWIRDGVAGGGSLPTLYGVRIDALTRGSTANMAIAIGGTGVGSAIYFNATTAVSTEYIYSSAASTLDLNANTTLNLRIGTTTQLAIAANTLTPVDGLNIVLATGTGMKIGTGTTQKLGFWNATPVVQPASTGTTTAGFTANTSANAVFAESTFTGNTGSAAYTISDIVRNLKTAGLLAS
jgi:hypothetical protein